MEKASSNILDQLSGDQSTIAKLVNDRIIQTGHFGLSGGGCSNAYVNKDHLLGRPYYDQILFEKLASRVSFRRDVGTVIGPQRHGVSIAFGIALAIGLTTETKPRFVAAYREHGQMTINERSLHNLKPPFLIVDDVVTTLKTIREVEIALGVLKSEVIGYACLIDRIPASFASERKVVSLVKANLPYWSNSEGDRCPDCIDHVPFDQQLGHARHQQPTLFNC